jgi:uncharacterized protein (DUF58 family)
MTFRPSALVYALVVVASWAFCLAIALGRVELFFVAVPLLVPILRTPAPRTTVEGFDLVPDTSQLLEGEELTVAIEARLRIPSGPVEILPVLPALLSVSSVRPGVVLAPPADGRIHWENHLRCEASGTLLLGVVFFRVRDRAGIWLAEVRYEKQATVLIYPRASLVRFLPTPRQTAAPFGTHLSRKLGDGTDFADIRAFVTGDRMRRINWAVSLRTRRLHVDQFMTERSGEIILLIDTFTNIGRRPDSSLDHCLRAAASLALSYLRQHDRVGMMDYGGLVHWTHPAAGPTHYAYLLRSLAWVSVSPTEFLQDLTALPEAMLHWHSVIVALTPLADDRFAKMVGRLAEQGRDVVLLALRTDELCARMTRRLGQKKLVQRLWMLEREERLRELRGHGIRALNWSPALPIESALMMVRRPVLARYTSW